jgi:hypothetical protein
MSPSDFKPRSGELVSFVSLVAKDSVMSKRDDFGRRRFADFLAARLAARQSNAGLPRRTKSGKSQSLPFPVRDSLRRALAGGASVPEAAQIKPSSSVVTRAH